MGSLTATQRSESLSSSAKIGTHYLADKGLKPLVYTFKERELIKVQLLGLN